MDLKIFPYLVFLPICISSSDNELVDYYVNLISEEIKQANNYKLPNDAYEFKPKQEHWQDYGTYDYIIIGAGTTGSVVANRLTEDAHTEVLLLEAGGDESDFSKIPAMFSYLLKSKYNWNYVSTPQTTSCLGMNNKQCPLPRGKGMGGTSAINGLLYGRGSKQDYDYWASLGNTGWSYNDVLPYFKKSENFIVGNDYRGVGGYLNIDYNEPMSPLGKTFCEANNELKRKIVDFNAEEQLGLGRPQIAKRKHERLSSASAFVTPILNRKNLYVSKDSFVTKILISADDEAYGVIFVKNGVTYKVTCRKEVILSAGVFGSPQLLMLSGIGPRFHLEQLGIPVLKDLPVGNGFEDHAGYLELTFSINYTPPYRSLQQNVKDYLNNFGPLTKTINLAYEVFAQTRLSKIEGSPDVELFFIAPNNPGGFHPELFNYNSDAIKALQENLNLTSSFQMFVFLLHPRSEGSFRLNSASPFIYPSIDPRLLSDPDGKDIQTLYEGIQLALQITETSAFKEFNVKLKDNTLPECKHLQYLSKEYWYCQLRQLGLGTFHTVGTCKMGPNSTVAVVNPELRVFGVKNLRVADTSVFPTSITGHPMATAVMIGEKLSDFIRKRD